VLLIRRYRSKSQKPTSSSSMHSSPHFRSELTAKSSSSSSIFIKFSNEKPCYEKRKRKMSFVFMFWPCGYGDRSNIDDKFVWNSDSVCGYPVPQNKWRDHFLESRVIPWQCATLSSTSLTHCSLFCLFPSIN